MNWSLYKLLVLRATVILFFIFSAQSAFSLGCNNQIQVSVDANCEALIHPDMILEGSYSDYNDFTVSLSLGNQPIANPITSNFIGQNIKVKIKEISTGNSCWGLVLVEDKQPPFFVCPTDTIRLTCTDNIATVPQPVGLDNCDNTPIINQISNNEINTFCEGVVITKVFGIADYYGNIGNPCKQVLKITQVQPTFPDDVTWTCEQYAKFPNIIDPTSLHIGILQNADLIDQAFFNCESGLGGDDVVGVAPYQTGTPYWLDTEDLDVSLDPNFDDNYDNPINDNNPTQCGTPTAELDNRSDIFNLSVQIGCPYYNDCVINPSAHTPLIISVPNYLPNDPAGLPARGLEDADVLQATGSGVPNVFGINCKYAVTYNDERLEACPSIDKNNGSVFKILRTWTIYNHCNNVIKQDIQVIKVIDKVAPKIVFNDDDNGNGIADENETNERFGNNDGFRDQFSAAQTTSGGHRQCLSNALLDIPEYTDGCSGIESIRVYTPAGEALPEFNGTTIVGFRIPSPFLSKGIHTITYEVIDICGNRTVADKKIEIIDGVPPTPICRTNTKITLSSGASTSVNASIFNEASYDNCGDVYFKVRRMTNGSCSDANIDKFNEQNFHRLNGSTRIDTPQEWFDDNVHFCCEDIGSTVMVVLRVYDEYLGNGAVPTNPNSLLHINTANYLDKSQYPNSAYLNNNRYNDCMIEVQIEDKTSPTCIAPADVWTTCMEVADNIDWNDSDALDVLFGVPTSTDNCGGSAEELTPTVNLDQCGVGQVTRRFRANDNYNNNSVGSCRQTIMIRQVLDYKIVIPGDFEGECVDVTPQEIEFEENGCDLFALNDEEIVFNASANGECRKIIRTYKLINWCEYDGISAPTVLPRLDINNDGRGGDGTNGTRTPTNHNASYFYVSEGTTIAANIRNIAFASSGYYEYIQHIKIFDNTAPVLTAPSTTEFCGGDMNEADCKGEVNLKPAIEELCSQTTTSWRLDLFKDGIIDAQGNGDFKGRYTLGNHTVKFIVSDDCGNTSFLDVPFTIIDCKAPTPVCHNGLSINLMQSGMVEIWATDFDASSFDYCHPIKFKLNKITDTNGDGFITNDDYLTTVPANDSVQFNCSDIGAVFVQLWVGEVSNDTQNNWDFCTTFIEVTDHNSACNTQTSRVALGGKITNEYNESIENVEVRMANAGMKKTDDTGEFMFPDIPMGSDVSISPMLNSDIYNGVSTFDIVMINKHILNTEILDSPYKLIAADANNSRSVSTLDLVAIQKVVLRSATEFPNNDSWRFVDARHIFSNQSNPFNDIYLEVRNFNNLDINELDADFIGIKIGDVTGDAIPNSILGIEDRTLTESISIVLENQKFENGELIEVPFEIKEANLGYQFTIDFDENILELVEISDGLGSRISNFNIDEKEGQIATSFVNKSEEAGKIFTLQFRTKSFGSLSDVLKLNSSKISKEVYLSTGEMVDPKLVFESLETEENSFALFENYPNPAKDRTLIRFEVPEDCEGSIELITPSGKILNFIKSNFNKGLNEIEVDLNPMEKSGILLYEIKTPYGNEVGKIIVIR